MTDLRIGISGWSYREFRGKFYPKGLSQRVELEPMKELEKWIRQFSARVEKQYSKLDALLQKEKAKLPEQPELFD